MTRCALVAAVASVFLSGSALAEDLYKQGAWSALAVDQRAARVGDSLTVLVYETSTASNSSQNGARKASRIAGEVVGDTQRTAGSLDLSNSFQGSGQTGRAQKMLAQISVVVEAVLPNGDLQVAGAQSLRLNGEATTIAVRGQVRPQDIASDNTVLSTRLAQADISYDGTGYTARGAKPGLFTRAIGWLGLP